MEVILVVVLLIIVQYGLALKPNVVFIVVDDLRPSLGVYGDVNAHTPNIDKLSERSFLFTNAFAQVLGILSILYSLEIFLLSYKDEIFSIKYYWFIASAFFVLIKGGLLLYGIRNQSLCAPSRNSFLTSRRPDSLHLYDFYSYWRNSVGNFTTLPQLFKENGYFTHSIGKIFHPGVSSNYTDDYPLSWSVKPFHPKTQIYKNAKVCMDSNGVLAQNLICPVIVNAQPGGTLPDLESLDAALKFLKNDNIKTPFFLAVGFHKPHIPLKFPINYLNFHPLNDVVLPKFRTKPSSMPTVAWNPWLDVKKRDDMEKLNVSFPFGLMPDNITRKIIQNYNAAISYIDDLIGSLLAEVNFDNTVIVLTSDHGWSRGEHGEFSKFSNFETANRVPLIIHVPGLNNKKIKIDQLVELVDLFPTLVDLTQVAPSMEICRIDGMNSKLCTEGRSLVPIMVKKKHIQSFSRKSAVFWQYPRPGVYPTQNPDSDEPKLKDINIMGYSIRTNRYRYTEWVKFNHTSCEPDWSISYDKELYDHLIDPLESLNLASRTALINVVDSLRKKLILGWRYV